MTMQPFKSVTSRAMSMLEDNIDTDVIFPARFLLITAREGLGQYAFYDRRNAVENRPDATHFSHNPVWGGTTILLAGANFGCGSSREQAVWALSGMGIRCIIAPGFGEIFYANCLRNGVLPVILPSEIVGPLAADAAAGKTFTVDLITAMIAVDGGQEIAFSIADEHRDALLNGWDETDMILNMHAKKIDAFEGQQRATQSWLYNDVG